MRAVARMLTTLHLALGATPPAPPPPVPCFVDATSTCDGCAALADQQAHYDLSPLRAQGDVDVPGTGSTNPHYHLRICEAIDTANACSRSSIATHLQAVVQTEAVQSEPCNVCGSVEDHAWSLQDPTNPLGGVKLTFSGGDLCARATPPSAARVD
eukprot:1424887-Prymnesium_polylepis.1